MDKMKLYSNTIFSLVLSGNVLLLALKTSEADTTEWIIYLLHSVNVYQFFDTFDNFRPFFRPF